MKLTAIYIYPVKSLAGIALQEAMAGLRGLEHDRRWMLTDMEGVFLTQREFPEMALLQPSLENDQLVIRHRTKPLEPLSISLREADYGEERTVTVWDSVCEALHVSEDADQWFSESLGAPCQLVYMHEDSVRPTDPDYGKAEDMVSFADGYPFLIIGEAAMNQLNSKLEEPLSIVRFRPNFVFSGGAPHEEDDWKNFSIGAVQFRGVKRCGRCQIPTIDPETGIFGKEPLPALTTYRRFERKLLFGMNVCLDSSPSMVRVGDLLIVKEKNEL